MKKDDIKITNEKPVKIPLGFDEALRAILKVKPENKVSKSKKKAPKLKKRQTS